MIIAVQICHHYFFVKVDFDQLSKEERQFRFFMGLELLTMSSYIVSSIAYILISMIKPPAMQLTAGTVADQRRDFIHGSRVQLAFFISVMTPHISFSLVS